MGLVHRLDGLRVLRQPGRVPLLLSSLVAASIFATATFTIWHSRQSALDQHQRSMRSMGVVLAEQTARYVQVIDLMVLEMKSRIADLGIASPIDFQHRLGTQEVQVLLAQRLKNVPQADAITLVDADGLILNSSPSWPLRHADVSGRSYYTYFREHDDPGIFISSLSEGPVSGSLNLFFARRISGPEGRFLGLVLGVIDINYLNDFYRAASEQKGEAVTLLRRDGTMLMRYPNPEQAVGVKLPLGSPWYDSVAGGGGSYITPGALDSTPSLVSVHPLRDYPLVVDVLLDEALAFAQWRIEAACIASYALAATLAFSGLFWLLARQFQRQAEQNAKLEEATFSLGEGQRALRAYAEMSVDWFWEQDADYRFNGKTNTPFMEASDDTGLTRWELAGPAMSEEQWAPHKADLAARRPFRNFRWERTGPDGAHHFMIISGDPIFDCNGAFSGYRGTGREVTAEVQANARLTQANAELELGRQQIEAVLSNITQGGLLVRWRATLTGMEPALHRNLQFVAPGHLCWPLT